MGNLIDYDPKNWVRQTLHELGQGIYERGDTIAMTLLTVLSGQSVFLYGPPGTAKSLIARRISCIFSDSRYFEYLMQRFSTPEEVFGPVSISELKNDNYLRKTENYLPTADIAFLDEIWKSSPAILNTLLTIINERKFKNGSAVEEVPLKAVIAASNEFPAKNSGLDALYDRFIVRLCVNPMNERENFERMISDSRVTETAEISEQISTDGLSQIIEKADRILLGSELLETINTIREKIAENNDSQDNTKIYVSDRRWQKAVFVIKTATMLSGRTEAVPADALVLRNCLWSSLEDKDIIQTIVTEAVAASMESDVSDYEQWCSEFDKLSKEVSLRFKPGAKNYKGPVSVNNMGCYPLEADIGPNGLNIEVFVPFGPKRIGGLYSAYGMNGTTTFPFEVMEIKDGEAVIRFTHGSQTLFSIPLEIRNDGLPSSGTRSTYIRSAENMERRLCEITESMKVNIARRSDEFDSPFVQEQDIVSFFDRLNGQLGRMEESLPRIRNLIGNLRGYAN